jgi:(1->4)-alpha-D-glucan 1-alpha-D-glucosylmutase
VVRGFAPFTEAGRLWPRMEALEGSVSLQGLSVESANGGLRELPLASLFTTLPVAVLKARTATASKRVRHRIST